MKNNYIKWIKLSVAVSLAMLITACGSSNNSPNDQTDVTLTFAAKVNESDFTCGDSYPIGTSTKLTRVDDFRLFVSNARMRTGDGEEEPIELIQDGIWQFESITLLDFEDGCGSGTPEKNSSIKGRISQDVYTSICLDIGVPVERNHLDNVTQPSPLNSSGMFWNWQGGYKFLRVDMMGDPGAGEEFTNQGYNVHIGSTGCSALTAQTAPTESCTYPNVTTVCLDDFDHVQDTIKLDLGNLLAQSDTTVNTPDTSPGCMSSNDDPECQAIMPLLGLSFYFNNGSMAEPMIFNGQPQQFISVHHGE